MSDQQAAAAAAPAASTTVSADTGAQAQAWTAGLGDDLKPWVSGMGLDKLPPDQALAKVLPMYRGAEQKLGVPADQILRLPGKDAKPEEMRALWSKLGAPEKPEGYEIKAPDGADPAFLNTAVGWFHELGVPKSMAAGIAGKWNEYIAAQQVAEEGAWNQRFEKEIGDLKNEWGADFDKNRDLASRVERSLGLKTEELQAMERALGPKSYQQFLARFGSSMGEHRFVGGEGEKGFGLTPEGAKARITELQKDDAWTKKYLAGDADAKAEFTRLHQIAFGSEAANSAVDIAA